MAEESSPSPFVTAADSLGALDLGSNSFHLVIGKEHNGRVQVIDRLKDMVRLADGLNEDGSLSAEIAERALASLERFGQRLRPLRSENVRVVGTNTLRKANRATEFVRAAEAALGHRIDIISGREEARLIFLGVSHAIEDSADRRLVIDVGGGSTELVIGQRFEPREIASLQMGCVSISRNAFANGKLTKANFEAAENLARLELEPIAEKFKAGNWDSAVGASGTILAALDVIRAASSADIITPVELQRLKKTILNCDRVENLSLPGLSKDRAPVFPGGLAILISICESLSIDQLQATSGALRDGVLYDLVGRAQQDDVRERTISDAMQRYHVDVAHAMRVRDQALNFLAQVARDWELFDPMDHQLLGWAASLHEIGMDIAHSQYHKHGGYLLQNMHLPGFATSDQVRIAAIVRAHRRKFSLDELVGDEDRTHISRLAVLLRLAVIMHRDRTSAPRPHCSLNAADNALTIGIPATWMSAHPLTSLDLDMERDLIAPANVTLTVEVE